MWPAPIIASVLTENEDRLMFNPLKKNPAVTNYEELVEKIEKNTPSLLMNMNQGY